MSFIASLHNYLRHARGTGPREVVIPEGRTPMKKIYERMEALTLPAPRSLETPLVEALRARKTRRVFNAAPLPLADISSLFYYAAHASDTHRPYPSGGGCYPIEVYLIAHRLEGQKPGVFHYEPEAHVLRRLWDVPQDTRGDIFVSIGEGSIETEPAAFIVLTSVWKRTAERYRDFAYALGLLEAGHLAQNLCLVSEALSLGICPLGGFNDERIIELLDSSPEREQPVYLFAVGNHAPNNTKRGA